MAATFTVALVLLAGLPAALAILLLLQVVAARPQQTDREEPAHGGDGDRLAVLVPAHNESSGLVPTLSDVIGQLRPRDRLLVVADNCSDDTAEIARRAGAEVVERSDLERRGKGYALDHGVRHLAGDPPGLVVVLDADCRLGPGALDAVARACRLSGRPAQARYLMTCPPGAPVRERVAEFTWRIRNWVRPLGMRALGLPCPLMGTGMAFPWPTIRAADLATGHLVEDLKLGLDLARAGAPPLFVPTALVTSEFPQTAAAAETQRQRWEGGRLGVILRDTLPLLAEAIRTRNGPLLALVVDLAIPPLTLLALLNGVGAALGLAAALSGLSLLPLLISALGLAAFASSVWIAWRQAGRDILPARDLAALGAYALSKLGLHARIVTRGVPKNWVRTDRRDQD